MAWNARREDAMDRAFALYVVPRDAFKDLRQRFITCQQTYLSDLRRMLAEAERLSIRMTEVGLEIHALPCAGYVHDMRLLSTRVYALRRRVELALAAHDCDREEDV